jgi:hypothetical protein
MLTRYRLRIARSTTGNDRPMPPARVLSLLLVPVALGACGSGSNGGTATTSPTAAAGRPQQELATVQAALRSVRSFHVAGTQLAADGRTTLSGDVTATGSLDLTLTQQGAAVRILLIGRDLYLRATRGFWLAHQTTPAIAGRLAGHWVKVPADKATLDLSRELSPQTLAHCTTVNTGTIHDAGTATFLGRPVRVLVSAGDAPGSSPGQLFIATGGRPLPVRVLQTGPERPGGTNDPRCASNGPDTTRRSDLRLSRYDAPVHITAPRDVLDLQSLTQQGGSAS